MKKTVCCFLVLSVLIVLAACASSSTESIDPKSIKLSSITYEDVTNVNTIYCLKYDDNCELKNKEAYGAPETGLIYIVGYTAKNSDDHFDIAVCTESGKVTARNDFSYPLPDHTGEEGYIELPQVEFVRDCMEKAIMATVGGEIKTNVWYRFSDEEIEAIR